MEGEKGNMALIPLVEQDFSITPGRHACQFINATNKFFWVDYFDTLIHSKTNKTAVATLILPVESVDEAQKIVASKQIKKDSAGNLSVTFSKKGKRYSYQ